MPTAKYVYQDEVDPDETLPEESQSQNDALPTSSPQYTHPLPLRGGYNPSSQSSAPPNTCKLTKKARLRQLADMLDSDEEDEELSEQAFLEGLAKRQAEQARLLESPFTQRPSLCGDRNTRTRQVLNERTNRNDASRNDSLCTQDTTQMGNRTVDLTKDATLLGDNLDDFGTEPWEKDLSLFHPNNNNAMTTPLSKVNPSTLKSTFQKTNPSTVTRTFQKLKHSSSHNNTQWQTQAYQSSLTDLLSTFSTAPNDSEQTLASMHVAQKRGFDGVSRSLARLAVVSRSNNGNIGGGNDERDLPSPRSLPSFMSVFNVPGEGMGDVFVGQSVMSRSGRSVRLEERIEGLTIKAVELATKVCHGEASCGSGLVEAALEFLATAFACLECDLVYYMLLCGDTDETTKVTLFDVLVELAVNRNEGNTTTLAFLTLSRALEATQFVARVTSLDSACFAYASPHSIINTDPDMIEEGGVGFLSALGKDLGLRLDQDDGFRVRRLNDIARYAFDSILDFNPMISSDGNSSFYEAKGRGNDRTGRHNESLCIDTEVGNGDDFQCRQPSVVKDRMYAAHVEYLSSLISIGVVSGWLNESDRTIEMLCQKLFLVIETRSRLRRSTNQRTSKDAPGDSEAVCAASLSLLLLALPKYNEESASHSMSFRQMGGSIGTIGDIFESPLVKRMVELGLSSSCGTQEPNECLSPTKRQALTSILYVISDIVLVGGAPLISKTLGQQLNHFLVGAITQICKLDSDEMKNGAKIEAILQLILHLHNGSPMVVRQAMRNHFEQSSSTKDGAEGTAALFVGNLLQLSGHPCFAVSASASYLIRSLIKGNPLDDTPDVLSDIMRQSFESDLLSSSVDSVFHSLVGTIYSYNASSRSLPKICLISDVLTACLPSIDLQQVLSSNLSSEFKSKPVISVFVSMIEVDRDRFNAADTLFTSAFLSIIYLLGQVISCSQIDHDVNLLATMESVGLLAIESAMAQGVSADLTHRAMKHQKYLAVNEKILARAFARTRSSVGREENLLRTRIKDAEREISELREQAKAKELERAKLRKALNDQTLVYEKRLELVRFESQCVAKKSAEIHIQERQRAEQYALKNERLYRNEKERRRQTEDRCKSIVEESEKLKNEFSKIKDTTSKLEQALEFEKKEKENHATALETSKRELHSASDELKKSNNIRSDLETKLSHSEKTARDLTAANKDLENTVEEICEKLVNLATIYQRKEAEMDKYKAELRTAVNAANKNAEMAISKYEAQRKETKSLKKELESSISELNELKAHKADVQRLRKNAPTSYINQLRNDPRIQAQPRKSRSGKENSFNR